MIPATISLLLNSIVRLRVARRRDSLTVRDGAAGMTVPREQLWGTHYGNRGLLLAAWNERGAVR